MTAPRFSYGGFNSFRNRLTSQLFGFNYDFLIATGQGSPQWDLVARHPIYDLLNHSDCDGDLSAEQCRTIAPALRQALSNTNIWPEGDMDLESGQHLVRYMEICAEIERKLIFC